MHVVITGANRGIGLELAATRSRERIGRRMQQEEQQKEEAARQT